MAKTADRAVRRRDEPPENASTLAEIDADAYDRARAKPTHRAFAEAALRQVKRLRREGRLR